MKPSRALSRRAALGLGAAAVAGAGSLWLGKRWPDRSLRVSADREFVIFVLGGSTAMGEPYGGRTDLGQMVKWMFGGYLDGRPLRVANLAKGGRRAAEVLEDAQRIARLSPPSGSSVAFVYPGNNEFLRFDDEHDLSRQQRHLFDAATTTEAQRGQVIREYGEAVASIVGTLQGAGVPVVISPAAVNLRWDPNRSVLRDPKNAPSVRAWLERGEGHARRGETAAALEAYLGALTLERAFAITSFHAAQCLEQLGRFAEARWRYREAVDCDANPYRETSPEREALLAAARRTGAEVVDSIKLMEDASPDGIPGFNLFWDNCHPTLEGYLLIASGFTAALQRVSGVTRTARGFDLPGYLRDLGWGADEEARVRAASAAYCYRAATLTWDPMPRLRRADTLLREAAVLRPGDADIIASQAVVAALAGEVQQSVALWKRAWSLDPVVAERRAQNPKVRALLRRAGIEDVAREISK